jgi:hypothetical protein
MSESLEFFAAPGRMTSAGSRAGLLDGLPGDMGALCQAVQGLMVHIFWAQQYGLNLAESRRDEAQLRSVAQKLERILELDPQPLGTARPPERRLVGNCRDFSVLLTAILRQQGTPARARCGFALYFLPNHYEDHWVCEYWHAAQHRWVLVDAQLDELQCTKLAVPFSPLDVPRDQFIFGGRAWQLCRAGEADPETFGIFDMHGLWFVRGSLVRDLAALNKVELLPWDSWGLIDRRDEEVTPEELALLDHAAELTSGEVPEFAAVRRLYEEDERLRVPATIRSYTQAGVQVVDLNRPDWF